MEQPRVGHVAAISFEYGVEGLRLNSGNINSKVLDFAVATNYRAALTN